MITRDKHGPIYMNSNDYKNIRQLFDDYIQMYAGRDDRLTTYFSEDFSGFTGSGDFLVKDREKWAEITREDFAQVSDPIRIDLIDLSIQLLADTIAVTTGFFTINLPIEDHILSGETARLVLIFRKETQGWKISHSSISIPYYQAREGEVYPLKELTSRNLYLEKLVLKRTIQLQKLNENLMVQESHYRLLTENASDVVWRVDKDFSFTYISPADERLRGYSAEEVLGHSVLEIFDEEGIETLKKMVQKRQELEQLGISGPMVFEAKHRCKDGRWLWAEVSSSPERDENGEITGYHGISREITERKQAQELIQQLAFYDTLTKLPNRRLLDDRLEQALSKSKRFGHPMAVLYLDLDNFKQINDSFGHDVGDELLKVVADRLLACVRGLDTVCRQGGDEFFIVLSEITQAHDAQLVAEKIIRSVNETICIKGNKMNITTSIGIALYQANSPDSAVTLVKKADIAMYEAKHKGRNRFSLYQE